MWIVPLWVEERAKYRTKMFLGSKWQGQNRQWEQNVLCVWECPQGPVCLSRFRAWPCYSSLGTGSEPRQALSRLQASFHLGYPKLFASGQAFVPLLLPLKLARFLIPWLLPLPLLCWTVHCHLLWLNLMGLGQNTPTHITSLAPYWDPTQATTEQRCSSKNWLGIQILELFRNINFSSGHQKSWSVIGCWVCHRTDPILFLSDYLAWGKGWLTRAISFYSHSDLISETLLLFLLLGLAQSHLCPFWQMSLT